jgi:hypothetical protein
MHNPNREVASLGLPTTAERGLCFQFAKGDQRFSAIDGRWASSHFDRDGDRLDDLFARRPMLDGILDVKRD